MIDWQKGSPFKFTHRYLGIAGGVSTLARMVWGTLFRNEGPQESSVSSVLKEALESQDSTESPVFAEKKQFLQNHQFRKNHHIHQNHQNLQIPQNHQNNQIHKHDQNGQIQSRFTRFIRIPNFPESSDSAELG